MGWDWDRKNIFSWDGTRTQIEKLGLQCNHYIPDTNVRKNDVTHQAMIFGQILPIFLPNFGKIWLQLAKFGQIWLNSSSQKMLKKILNPELVPVS